MSFYTTECRLTASGLDDLILPISTVSVRMRHQLASYMSWTLPDPLPWADQIIDRISGNMLLYCSIDGGDLVQVLRTFLRNIYFTQGDKKMALTLAGDRQISFASVSAQATIEKMVRQKRNEDDTYTLEVKPDFDLTPYYVVNFGGPASLILDTVFFNIGKDNATMTISGTKVEVSAAARWMMDEGTGTYVEDVLGGYHGEIDGSSDYTTWGLTGTGGPPQTSCVYMQDNFWPHDVAGVLTTYYLGDGHYYPMTMEMWLWLSADTENYTGLILADGSSNWFEWGLQDLTKPVMGIRNTDSGLRNIAEGAEELPLQEWVHTAVTISDTEMILYKNGNAITLEYSLHENPLKGNQPYPLRIGYSSRWSPIHGRVADVRIWNEVRTQQQIIDNMAAGRGGL